jgi:hypothetical protein
MRAHAGWCPECAVLLRIHEHLSCPAQAEIEEAVPDELVTSVWPRVRAAIESRAPARSAAEGARSGWRWLVPALAAAGIALAVGTGALTLEVRELHGRERILAQRIAEQEILIAELDIRTSPGAAVGTAVSPGAGRWERMLTRGGSVTVEEIETALALLPANAAILDPRSTETLLRRLGLLGLAKRGGAIEGIRGEDGLQPAEALQLVRRMDLDPQERISTDRLLAWSRSLNLDTDL